MLATSTHDTKRGEDARARLDVLSEIPEEWSRAVARWAGSNAAQSHAPSDGELAPDRNDEYLFYQTLLGAWPRRAVRRSASSPSGCSDYMLKAIREAKLHTSWIHENRGLRARGGALRRAGADGAARRAALPGRVPAVPRRGSPGRAR